MIRYAVPALVLALFVTVPASGQPQRAYESEAYRTCMTSGPGARGATPDMVGCMVPELARLDAELNRSYGRTMAVLEAYDRFARDLGVAAAAALREAQRAWIIFRDANCRAHSNSGGTMDRLTHPSCMMEMTAARTAELDALAAQYGGDER